MTHYDAVDEAIDLARQEHGMKWADVARESNLHPQTLRRYRQGEVRTDDTTRAIERVFGWGRGHLDAIASDQTPPSEDERDATGSPPQRSEREELLDMVSELQDRMAELMRRIDDMDKGERGA